MLNLDNLRQSLCFKSLFEPGVCCPKSDAGTDRPSVKPLTSSYIPYTSTTKPLKLKPVTTVRTTGAPPTSPITIAQRTTTQLAPTNFPTLLVDADGM